jgi:molecular chaperone Hsp33
MTTQEINPYKITKFIDLKAGIRATVVNATAAVQEMQTIQNTYPIATMMVGRSMVASALMAAHLKSGEMVSIYFRGDGPIQMVFAEGNYEGEVRGYTPNPQIDLPLIDGRLDLSGAIGKGSLTVVRTNSANQTPYRGTVEIQTGEVGDDIAYYLQQSQQAKAVVSVGVKVSAYGKVISAGGVLIELLPDASSTVEFILANRVEEASSLSEAIENGATALDLANLYLDGFQLTELEHKQSIVYSCRCSENRLRRSLDLLPLVDLDDIVSKGEPIKAKCEFCGREYELPATEAQNLRDKKYRNSLN